MKKIAIMLLAALMLFAFVACDDNKGDETVPTLKVSAWTEGKISGIVSEFNVNKLSENLKIENGKVTGTLKPIDNFTEFSGDDAENDGYFFAFKIDEKQFKDTSKVTMTSYKDGKVSKQFDKFDAEFIYRLGGKDLESTKNLKTFKLECKEGDEVYSITFDFSELKLGKTN